MWASNPELFTNEEGTAKKSRAYIVKEASYIDQKKGGGGLMHLRSHIRAFYAQWVRRYLHPSNPPWKSIVDTWLADPYPMGRGSILADIKGELSKDIPLKAKYLRVCVQEFEALGMKQDLSIIDAHVEGESVDLNHRFQIPLVDEYAAHWSQYVGFKRIHHLIDQETNDIFSEEDVKDFTYKYAPDTIKDTPAVHEWSDKLMETWDTFKNAVPQNLIHEATKVYTPKDGDYVAITPDHIAHYYARAEADPTTGTLRYHRQWLDTFSTPHDTDDYVTPFHLMNNAITPAALWIEEGEEDAHYTFQHQQQQCHDLDDEPEKETKVYIMGPTALTFPNYKGWSPATNNPDPNYAITKLPHLTIKRLTKLFTLSIINDKRPNCETNWPLAIGRTIPFEIIWPTLGTPLSDATEEKNWRKMLHRAIFV